MTDFCVDFVIRLVVCRTRKRTCAQQICNSSDLWLDWVSCCSNTGTDIHITKNKLQTLWYVSTYNEAPYRVVQKEKTILILNPVSINSNYYYISMANMGEIGVSSLIKLTPYKFRIHIGRALVFTSRDILKCFDK